MIRSILITFSIFFLSINSFSQKRQSNEQYIAKYYKIAVQEMNTHKIPASITLAQGILESAAGNSALAKKAKNHFGIKCHGWKGRKYYMDDDTKDECFRVYNSPEQSFIDHSAFLTKRGRYEFLFNYATTDYKKWAQGLKKAGYATNPKYPKLLIDLIERYELYKYDKGNFIPVDLEVEGVLVLEKNNEKDFVLEETDEYIKALMGRNVYYSDKEKGIFIFNRIKTIKAKGRTPLEIAVTFDINYDRFLKYNEIDKNHHFLPMQNVFLQPKRFKGSQKTYLVKPGDSMWDISQMFGVKEFSLHKKNLMKLGEQAKPGETLNLKRKRKTKIQTITYKGVLKTKRLLKANEKPEIIKPEPKNEQQTIININVIDKNNNQQIEIVTPGSNPQIKVNKKIELGTNENIGKKPEIDPAAVKTSTGKEENNTSLNTFVHVVKQGETLYYLSTLYKNSVEELLKINKLENNSIDIGQELIILKK